MFSHAIALLVFHATSVAVPPEVQVSLVFVDREGHDVTAEVPVNMAPTEILVWPEGETDGRKKALIKIGFDAPIKVATLRGRRMNVQLARDVEERCFAPGWVIVGDAAPGIVLEPMANEKRRIEVVVTRARRVRMTWTIPDDVPYDDELVAGVSLIPKEGPYREVSFSPYDVEHKVLKEACIDTAPGRYELWGRAGIDWIPDDPGVKMWAHSSIEVLDRDEVQEFVVAYQRGVEIHGRLVGFAGKPIRARSGSYLGVRFGPLDHRATTAGKLYIVCWTWHTFWYSEVDGGGHFSVSGVPPGAELAAYVFGGPPNGSLRVPARGGDVGEILICDMPLKR